jgi:hypothetical protein
MNTNAQPELSFVQVAPDDPNVGRLVKLLDGSDWTTANDIIQKVFTTTNVRWQDRQVRALAAASQGEIAGGQRGYKLVRSMTHGEFMHVRNWMSSQATQMQKRILEMDKVFYARKPIATS